jgi:Bacterial antitoxin of type II TA system, VapB
MRTTLDIDDDLLAAAKEIARREGTTAGEVVSRLLRRSLTGAGASMPASRAKRSAVAGFMPFPARAGVVVTNEQVDRLRDAEGI